MSLSSWIDQERRRQDETLQELNRLAVALEFSPSRIATQEQQKEFVLCLQNIETYFGKDASSYVDRQLGRYFSMGISAGEISTFQGALGECRTTLRGYLRRRRGIALGLVLLTAVAAAVAFLVHNIGSKSAANIYEEYEFSPHIDLEKEEISYVLPALTTPGPDPRKTIGRSTGQYPRWFSYHAEIKNAGTHPMDIRAVWMCAGPKMGECTHHFEIRRGVSLEPGGRVPVAFEPAPSEESLLPDLASLRFFLQIEVLGPGKIVGINRYKVGGFEEQRPVIVREGTVVPELTEAVFDLDFVAPLDTGSSSGPRTGQSQVRYAVRRIPD